MLRHRASAAPRRAFSTSLTRGLFLGELRAASLAPFPPARALTAAQKETLAAYVEPTRSFLSEVNDAAGNDAAAAIPAHVRRGLSGFGAYGLAAPEAFGGLGLNAVSTTRLFQLFGSADLGIGAHLAAHQAGCSALLLAGTPAQAARFVPALARGERLAGLTLADARGTVTRATLDGNRTTWRVSGRKAGVVNAAGDFFTVFARTASVNPKTGVGADQLTAFAVERAAGGVSHGAPEQVLGVRCSSAAEVHFEATAVTAENVLGEVGGGRGLASRVLDSSRACARARADAAFERARFFTRAPAPPQD